MASVTAGVLARGVVILAFLVKDPAVAAHRFVLEQKVAYPVALDPRLTLANRFGFKGTPYTVVVDRRGEMAAQLHGESVVRRLPRLLDSLVGTPSVAGASP